MANWGEGLKGLGMYWSGQGAQYEQGRRADEEQRLLMDAARREQLLRDAFTVKNQLESGDINSARYLLTQRLDKLREEGVDSSDTFTVLDMLNKGNIDGALREVSTVVDYANQFGDGGSSKTAAIRDYEYFSQVLNDPNATEQERNAAAYQIGAAGRPQGRTFRDQNGNLYVTDAATGEVIQTYGPDGRPITTARSAGEKGQLKEGEKGGEDRQALRKQRIDVGVDAARGIPTAKRALELLKTVETGGVDALELGVKQRLGIENAEEGELANLLGKAVLSQLRATFGAQFTEREGALLQRIEAGIGKSNAANVRALKNVIKLAERRAKQAMDDAAAMGDYATAAAIKEELEFSLGGPDDYSWIGGGGNEPPPGFVVDN